MNNFIKNAANKMYKPYKKIIPTSEKIALKECIISFNFENFYYLNEIVFNKQNNTLDDLSKSWTIMESFSYEKYVIKGIIQIIKKYAYINDIYFVPIGWLTGIDDNEQQYHVVIKLVFESYVLVTIKNKVKEYCSFHSIKDLHISQTSKDLKISVFEIPQNMPSALVSLYPFDTEYIMIVLFFGICDESYCGISYITNKENLYNVIEFLKPLVLEINLIIDEISKMTSLKIFNSTQQCEIFPEKKIISICEIMEPLDKKKIDGFKINTPINITLFVKKKIVSLLDVPSNVDIKCMSSNGVDFITHIDNKRLSTVLIIAKDDFIKDVIFSGTFKKENLIWKGCYTYRIIESSFLTPKLNVLNKSNNKKCKKHTFNNHTFTTKTGSYVI
ncbi:47L protein [Yaba-like disease virus]|uniref:47L protein n=1 Tax=Yaba-like disease virus TaxID=132475 RepID=Q9DHR5_YLDV|nr:47L protein [Yaba-like disease virus]CAC21285.1 47L protein [Yaba-like disease virus]